MSTHDNYTLHTEMMHVAEQVHLHEEKYPHPPIELVDTPHIRPDTKPGG